MARSIPLRRSLLANLVFLVVAFGGATWLAMLWGERRIVAVMCRSSISQTLDLTEQRLNAFFDPILRDVELLRFLGDSGELDTDDSDRLRRLLIPLLRQNPQVSGVMIADSRGREFYLTHDGNRWRSRRLRIGEWKQRALWDEWDDQARHARIVVGRRRLRSPPATMVRGCLGAAAQRRRYCHSVRSTLVHILDAPYRLLTTNAPGLTASTWLDVGDGVDRVIGFDILLREIAEFTTKLHVSQHGKLFLLDGRDQVIGLPADPRFDGSQDFDRIVLSAPEKLGIPAVAQAGISSLHHGIPVIPFSSSSYLRHGQLRNKVAKAIMVRRLAAVR